MLWKDFVARVVAAGVQDDDEVCWITITPDQDASELEIERGWMGVYIEAYDDAALGYADQDGSYEEDP